MAITYVSTSSRNGNWTATSYTLSSFGVSNGSNRMLVVAVFAEGETATDINSVVFNGSETFTNAVKNNDGSNLTQVWYLLNPSNATGDIIVTFDSNTSGCGFSAVEFNGVSQTGQYDNNNQADHVNTTGPSVALDPVGDDCALVDVCQVYQSYYAISNPTQTLLHILNNSGDSNGGTSYAILSGSAETTFGWTFSDAAADGNQAVASFLPYTAPSAAVGIMTTRTKWWGDL